MIRRSLFCLSIAALCLFAPSMASPVQGQELVHKGILVTQILARTRFGVFERGDLVHVTVRQAGDNRPVTISVHAEYQDPSGKWRQVPPPTNMLAALYKSDHYGGLRDYVDFDGVSQTTERNIAMFMPFNGYSLHPDKDYTFRYVIRLWQVGKLADTEHSSLALAPYKVHVGKDKEGILVTIVDAQPCRFLAGSGRGAVSHPAGMIRFFDTKTGAWECPGETAATASVPGR